MTIFNRKVYPNSRYEKSISNRKVNTKSLRENSYLTEKSIRKAYN